MQKIVFFLFYTFLMISFPTQGQQLKDAVKIADYNEDKIQELMQDSRIIRNQLKIRSTVTNAQAFHKVQNEFGTFDKYIWQFTGGTTIYNNWSELKQIPAKSAESDAMSKDLIKRGFKFVGSTICYAFMQAAGMINDHMVYCSRHAKMKE